MFVQIGQLAKRTGVSVRALRHYDGLGLLTSSRADNRYRMFCEEDVERVRLIQLFLSVGFRLDEIRRWAPCFQSAAPADFDVTVADVRTFLQRKLTELDAQIAAMQALRLKIDTHMQHLEQASEPTPHEPDAFTHR